MFFTASSRDIIYNQRQIYRIRNGDKMPVEAFLGRLVVVGSHLQAHIGTGFFCMPGQPYGFSR